MGLPASAARSLKGKPVKSLIMLFSVCVTLSSFGSAAIGHPPVDKPVRWYPVSYTCDGEQYCECVPATSSNHAASIVESKLDDMCDDALVSLPLMSYSSQTECEQYCNNPIESHVRAVQSSTWIVQVRVCYGNGKKRTYQREGYTYCEAYQTVRAVACERAAMWCGICCWRFTIVRRPCCCNPCYR